MANTPISYRGFRDRNSFEMQFWGECPDHGATLSCKETRKHVYYRRRRFHCYQPSCKFRLTTVELAMPEGLTRNNRNKIEKFIKENF